MRILVVSDEVWRDDTNGGNVLSNMFDNFNADFAQIYCNTGTPLNNICKYYYQMTAGQVIRNFLKHSPIGKEIIFSEFASDTGSQIPAEQPNKKFNNFFHKYRWGIFFALEDFLWNTSNWKNDKLMNFIDDFNPDVIFAPCYGNKFMLKLTRFIAKRTGKKVISYISDDSYTLKQFNLSPYYWIRRFCVRRQLRKTFPYYSLVYTMTETQKTQCEKNFNANMKILRKANPFKDIPLKITVNKPIKMVYAGGIYCKRWKTLKVIVDALKEINKKEVKAVLEVYTGNQIAKKINKYLNDGRNSFIKGIVSQEELKNIYLNSDIAIHAESFDLKNRLSVRMSFSTKIVDCLASGCAVLAVCDRKQGGYVYLKENDAAICVDSLKDVKNKLVEIVNDPEIIIEFQAKAKKCCELNHDRKLISEIIAQDFNKAVENESFTD